MWRGNKSLRGIQNPHVRQALSADGIDISQHIRLVLFPSTQGCCCTWFHIHCSQALQNSRELLLCFFSTTIFYFILKIKLLFCGHPRHFQALLFRNSKDCHWMEKVWNQEAKDLTCGLSAALLTVHGTWTHFISLCLSFPEGIKRIGGSEISSDLV